MVDSVGSREDVTLDGLFDCLATSERRRLLALLHGQGRGSTTEGELAASLAGWRHDESTEDVSDTERERAQISLRHTYLPKLTEAHLIDRDGEDTVRLNTHHRAFEDPGIVEVIEDWNSPSAESLDALFRALSDGRRRTILDVLSHQYGSIHVETLARELGAEENGGGESAVPGETVERILLSLHHKHLPRLSEAGLIEHDVDQGTVEYRGHAALRVPWIHSVLQPDFRASVTGETEFQEMGTIDGREQVISFGQSLCDRANEELFAMFTDVDLLEAGCLTRIRHASERGVDVYLGTPDPDIREYVRENAPGVILWEPKTNWLNLPVGGNKVGRLLLCDREAVMLGTLREQKTDGVNDERAIIGEGADNTLVVMVTQLLSPHLDQIDERAGEIPANLPF